MRTSEKIYRPRDVWDAVDKLRDMGYTIHIIREGALIDDYLCEAPDAEHYNFIFESVYLNEWSSAYKMQRCAKVPRRIWEAIDARDAELFDELAARLAEV